jgi:glyoxylase-like metal-dependent hydrolase (beta-lactamase superfamily II)
MLQIDSHSLVIDPGASGSHIAKHCGSSKTDLFLTHGHADHISGVPHLYRRLSSPLIFASEGDLELFVELHLMQFATNFQFVKAGDLLKIGNGELRVLGLPGHTRGSIGLYSREDGCVFVGDTLFRGAIGSVDSRGAFWEMIRAIRESLLSLPNDTVVLPGHGPETTIGHEKRTNRFLVGDS